MTDGPAVRHALESAETRKVVVVGIMLDAIAELQDENERLTFFFNHASRELADLKGITWSRLKEDLAGRYERSHDE